LATVYTDQGEICRRVYTRYTQSLGMNVCIDSEVKVKDGDGMGMHIKRLLMFSS